MHRDSERHKLFSRRALMLGGGKAALLSILVGRMYYLQVIESERYATLAEENRINLRLLAPPRGSIVDRHGRPMADNQQNYRVVIVPEQAPDIERTLDLLSLIVPLSAGERRRIRREISRKRAFVPIPVRENLDWSEVARIEVNTVDLPGVLIDVGQSRHYAYGDETAHVLGYVAAVSENEVTGDPLLELPGFRIGKSGVEKVYDMALRGSGGSSQVEVNAVGRVIRELNRQEGQPGAELRLTIDLELQRFASERMTDHSASAVVMDVNTGEVLALVSVPAFDPNAFNVGLSQAEWESLVSNPKAPLTNKAIAGQYAPGSTFKPVVALAALEKGVISPETRIHCSGVTKLGTSEFHCWKRGGHGTLDLQTALERSCDVYFYEVARRTGIERIGAMAKRMGLGEPLGLDLPGEKGGLVPSNEWKKGAIGSSWQLGETLIAGIGQGYILSTPMQLAVMTSRIVNGGRAVTPRMTLDVVGEAGIHPYPSGEAKSLGVSPEHLAQVRHGMERVVNLPTGTAFRSRIEDPRYRMGGKTGTVQVRRISKAERETGVLKNEQLPWKDRDHAIFIGYAPFENPRFAVSVVVEHGGGGSAVAAPIARDILAETQRLAALRPVGGRQEAQVSQAFHHHGSHSHSHSHDAEGEA
ncbi:MAG: penicillin-binding protein 2 [Rhodospirillales bacterium]|nr:penicillin-binding protein 2 [Rhodospirillales bacterium]